MGNSEESSRKYISQGTSKPYRLVTLSMEAAGSKSSRRVIGRYVVGFAVTLLMVVLVSVVIFGPYYPVITVSTTSSLSTTATSTFATQPETYTVNGLMCHFWQGTPSNVTSLVQNITHDTRFLNATEKGQFMFGNYEDYGNGTQII